MKTSSPSTEPGRPATQKPASSLVRAAANDLGALIDRLATTTRAQDDA